MEQNRTIEDQTKSLDKLEKKKVKVETRLATAKTEFQNEEHRARDELQQAQQLLHSQATAMAELAHREKKVVDSNYWQSEWVCILYELRCFPSSALIIKWRCFPCFVLQLLDFCAVIAQKLGVSMPVSLPSCEVIKRLETFIHSGHHFPLASQCVMLHHQHHMALFPDAPACSITTAGSPGPEVPVEPLFPATTTTWAYSIFQTLK